MRRFSVLLFTVGLVLATLAPAVAAARPAPVTFDSTMNTAPFGQGQYNDGTFVNTNGNPLLCAAGSVLDTRYVFGAPRSGNARLPDGIQLMVDKTLFCGDEEIYVRLQIHGVFATETFTWVILGGTGDYAGLGGQGSGWTEACDGPACVVNHYLGALN